MPYWNRTNVRRLSSARSTTELTAYKMEDRMGLEPMLCFRSRIKSPHLSPLRKPIQIIIASDQSSPCLLAYDPQHPLQWTQTGTVLVTGYNDYFFIIAHQNNLSTYYFGMVLVPVAAPPLMPYRLKVCLIGTLVHRRPSVHLVSHHSEIIN